MKAYETFPTPLGDFTVVVDDSGAVVAAAFGGRESVPGEGRDGAIEHHPARTAEVRRQVEEYFQGRRRCFELRLADAASPFQHRYREHMQSLAYGETTTYRELARRLGSSPRAAGRANATNPVCLIVPCHRVIGSDGSLTGYAYGIDIKRRLLEHEGAALPVAAGV